MKSLHFKAFISYNHHDEAWAVWLQKSLERYRVPRRLVGSLSHFGEIPERISPVFRDREDLSSAADLSIKIKDELAASETLVVICSPASAGSQWVNKEIRSFRQFGREERIFALIVDGDPQASDPAQQCFPAALTQKLDGSRYEPLAADVRKYADGKHLSKLKLVAGILGIRLDELRRRDAQRQRRNWLVSGIAALLIIALTTSLAITAISSKRAVALQKNNTEELLSYMLGNLKSLDPIVGLEVVDQNNEQVMNYLKNLGFQDMSNDQLVETALAWREEGQALHDRGELNPAMELFQQSRAAFIELHQREGGSTRAQFELGQAEFWVGYVYMDTGELDEAQASFTRYGALTRRLVNADPNNAEMVMELAYTLNNLGGLERLRQRPDIDKALQLTQSAMQYVQVALVLDPANEAYRHEMANITAFLADAWLDTCNLGKAYEFRSQNVELARRLYEEAPGDQDRLIDLASSLSGLARVQQQMSLTEQALDGFTESERLLVELTRNDPDNFPQIWRILWRRERVALIHASQGDVEGALEESRVLAIEFNKVFEAGMKADFEAAVDLSEFKINYSGLAQRMGETALAETEMQGALDILTSLVQEKPEYRASRYQLARATVEYWLQTGKLPLMEVSGLLQGFLDDRNLVRSCDDASLAARLAVMRENKVLARDYTEYLLGQGYFEPEFVDFCTQQGVCD